MNTPKLLKVLAVGAALAVAVVAVVVVVKKLKGEAEEIVVEETAPLKIRLARNVQRFRRISHKVRSNGLIV